MKLATLKDGTRDGQLVVVSRDLTRYTPVLDIAETLQEALDNWAEVACPQSPRSHSADEAYGIDMEAEIVVITDDVPMGVSAKDAMKHIKLIMLVNDVSLRGLIPGELAKGFGFVQSKASCAFSPVAVTPDEIKAWENGTIDLPLLVDYNGAPFGKANVKTDMTFNMAELVAHAAKTRHLCAGTIIGSGTVSNKFEGGEGKKIEDGGVGYSCIAEIRMIEKIQTGEFITPFMRFGDKVGIEMNDAEDKSIFGRIENHVEKYDA